MIWIPLAILLVAACDPAPKLPAPVKPTPTAAVDERVEADAGEADLEARGWEVSPAIKAAEGSIDAMGLPTEAPGGGGRKSIDPMGVVAMDDTAKQEETDFKEFMTKLRVYDTHKNAAARAAQKLEPLPDSVKDKPGPVWVDATHQAGLAETPAFIGGRVHAPYEDSGSGMGWADYDNDGDVDLYVARFNGVMGFMEYVPKFQSGLLFRNDGDGTFTDVTDAAGIVFMGQTLGASWADYDGDGHVDLYLANYGKNRLFRNDGDGTFTDVTDKAGVGDYRFAGAVTWGDYDRDGDIDLYLGNYSDTRINNLNLRTNLRRRYMGPFGQAVGRYETELYDTHPITDIPPVTNAQANLLYRNNGDGTFTDVAKQAGVTDEDGRSLGALFLDMDDDGWPDLYVANDVSMNTYFHNKGDGTFEDQGRQVGLRDPRAGMGMAIGDPDNDGDSDYFMSYFSLETNGMFENLRIMYAGGKPGRLRFASHEDYWGLGDGSYGYVGWGTGFFDYDLDGDQDLYIAHGHVADLIKPLGKIGPQRNSLFLNLLREEGTVRFLEVTDRAGPAWNSQLYCSRGAAVADYDNDGDPDLIVANMQDPIQLMRNDTQHGRRWLKIKLVGAGKNTEALGAFVTVEAGDLKIRRPVYSGAAYLSTDDRALLYGLDHAEAVDKVHVKWPNGKTQEIPGSEVKLDSLLVIREDG